jgi:RecB family endonuclease NucS
LEQEINEIRDKDIEWDRPYTSSLRRGFIAELFSKRGLLNDFKKAYWNNGNTARGEAKLRRYETIKRQYDDFITGRVGEGDLKESLEDLEAEQAFAAEADLRDFLANNLSVIEQGLRLYQDGTRSGVEYPIDNGYIDILAVDKNNHFAVIELKVGRGRNRVIGRISYYMAWVDKNLGGTCRGIIIAREIPDDLALAVKRIPGVGLYKYKLNVTVEAVSSTS